MNLVNHFQRAIDHDTWANREFCRCLGSIAAPPEKAVSLFAHVIAAEWMWLGRLRDDTRKPVVWPAISLTECRKELGELKSVWDELLGSLDDAALNGTFSYTNSKGEAFSSTVADALSHVVLHSSYHRGQIAAVLREAGHAPPYTDFIHAARQGKLA